MHPRSRSPRARHWGGLALVLFALTQPALAGCEGTVAVQILGSGGPIADDGRASAGYLLWVEGKARVLVDAGGGTFLRLGQAGGGFEDLSALLLSHFHADHASELPALLKSAWFGPRTRPLPIVGPSGAGAFPGLQRFLTALFGPGGAFAYLGGYLDGNDDSFRLEPLEVNIERTEPTTVYRDEGLTIRALPVPHGIVPALAYRLEIAGRSVVFAGDQNGSEAAFTDFARDADLLVLHFAIPDDAGPIARRLHATPRRLGEMAAHSHSHQVVLSHIMQRAWVKRGQGLASIRRHYAGPVSLARDLTCYKVERRP